ncbi:MAG TPA: ElyC/SanA/YdcF family protein [Chthoniobacterales bacterium]|nr:ElyC/SanA/YdcF family protein [Chthoniobacterales bacterium]
MMGRCTGSSYQALGRLWVRSLFAIILLNLGGIGLFLFLCDWWVSRAGGLPLFDSIEHMPANEVALVLGTAPVLAGGIPNRYFVARMNAAAALYHAGKAKVLLLSGNGRDEAYNEPVAMREALMARGVPREVLLEDPAGMRTLDSVIRAKSVFGCDRLTVISQEFHNRRTLFFCKHFQINGVAFNADPVVRGPSWRLTCREVAARAIAVLNVCSKPVEPGARKSNVAGAPKMTARI